MTRKYNPDFVAMFQKIGIFAIFLFVSGSVGQSLSWWQTSIIYQVYPRSFKDSDSDGIGDLKGIISKLDHFTNLGVDSFWLSPVYQSPMKDFGYDISNYTNIDPIFGTLQDFDNLITQAHNKGLKVIMDFVPGHTSIDHIWFNRSVHNESIYSTYYIWSDGIWQNETRLPPNNWLSVFGGPAWTLHPVRNQWYYHAFLPEQPDLNYRDANVQKDMKDVLRFWLSKGVDGFRVDAIEKLYEVVNVSQNEPLSGQNVPPNQYEYLNHTLTSNQPETISTVKDWYSVLQEYKDKDKKETYMVIELYAEPAVRNKLYETGGSPFNFDLIDLPANATGNVLRDTINREYSTLPSGKWPNFVLGNHDRRRVSHKFGSEYVDVFNMLLLTLWGTPTTYYGEEIGMLEADISWEQTVDPWGKSYGQARYQEFSRDPERTPMQWTGGSQAGFTNGNKTWLPLGKNYTTINVETETSATGNTSIKLYKQLARLRKKAAFQASNLTVAYVDVNVYSYIRDGGGEKYLVALNIGKVNVIVNFTTFIPMDTTATLIAATPGSQVSFQNPVVNLSSVHLGAANGIVLQITANKPSSAPWLRPAMLTWWLSIIHLPLIAPIIMLFPGCYNNL